ncbi:MAG: endolytic transglycosylase MltG [Actinomycetota bacterium]|nr:endolytic transglycosylase MltG [Actinomycetota bacterium]
MKRQGKSKRRHGEDLEARLDALRRSGPKKTRRRRRRSFGPTLFALLLLGAAFGAFYLVYTGTRGERPPSSDGPAKVEVVKGDTLTDVAAKLEGAGVIENAFVFKTQARIEGYEAEIKTGHYTFEPGRESEEILEKLTEGEAVPTIAVTIPEGLTLGETARTVAAGTDVTTAEFERAARETDYGYAFLEDPAIKTTEGYLFPRRYDFEKGVTAPQVVDRLLGQYLLETEGLDIAGGKRRHGLTEHELVTVASLIEKESANAEERPVIASVIYNRLRRDMPLQIDATVQYALERPKENLSLADLRTPSPYNTYEHAGIPPGPICSPSRQSLEAAINPEQTDYLYYVLKANDREHFFTGDYDAFLREKAEAGR